MRSSELAALEEARATLRRRVRRVVVRDVRHGEGWNPRTLRGEIEAEWRASGVRTFFREEGSR